MDALLWSPASPVPAGRALWPVAPHCSALPTASARAGISLRRPWCGSRTPLAAAPRYPAAAPGLEEHEPLPGGPVMRRIPARALLLAAVLPARPA